MMAVPIEIVTSGAGRCNRIQRIRMDRAAKPFPWREAMAFGLGRLRLSPDAFWAMTPRELAAAVEGAVGVVAAPMDRASLDNLMHRYPDVPTD
jgi:uncharacterized phage protein (TIGR02216 family)